MSCEAVVLTYLEWVRLVGCGRLRLHKDRVVRTAGWSGPLAQIDFDALMKRAPDVGMSATDYVIAEIKYEAWSPMSMHDIPLGSVLELDRVQLFSCFNESACQVMNATYKGPSKFEVKLFEQPALWSGWLKRASNAAADSRAERFIAHFNTSISSDKFKEEMTAVFSNLPETHHKSKGTRAFGWVTALAIPRKNLILSDQPTQASESVQSSIKNISNNYQVDTPFFDGISADIANEIFKDSQYEKIRNALVVCAAYVHYSYLLQRSNYKNFGYDVFCKDISWLNKNHIDLAAQLIDKIARDMSDELLFRILSVHPKTPVFENPATPDNLTNIIPEPEAVDEDTLIPPEKTHPEISKNKNEKLSGEITTGINPILPTEYDAGSGTQRTLLGDPTNEICPHSPTTKARSASLLETDEIGGPFTTHAKQKQVVNRVREQGIQKACKDSGQEESTVKKWVNKHDPELAAQLGISDTLATQKAQGAGQPRIAAQRPDT